MWKWTAVLAVAAVCGCGPTLGCSPVGPCPGGRLSGDPVQVPVEDWSFTDEVENIQLESRPDQPYSVTVWCVTHDGNLYVGGESMKTRWVGFLQNDERVRLRIDGRIYERRAVRVTDDDEIDGALAKISAKYGRQITRAEAQDGALFRMDARDQS